MTKLRAATGRHHRLVIAYFCGIRVTEIWPIEVAVI